MAGSDECTDSDLGKLIDARIDGIMKDGIFIMMEIKAIEPHVR